MKPTFINGSGLPRSTSDYTILGNWVFDNFILADELFPKTLQNPETYISVNKSLCGKLVSSLESPITFDEKLKVVSLTFFIPDFDLLSHKLESLSCYIESLYWYYIKEK